MLQKIGGGILIAVSVAVQLIVDKMDIALSVPASLALLMVCLIAALLGIALLRPQNVTRGRESIGFKVDGDDSLAENLDIQNTDVGVHSIGNRNVFRNVRVKNDTRRG